MLLILALIGVLLSVSASLYSPIRSRRLYERKDKPIENIWFYLFVAAVWPYTVWAWVYIVRWLGIPVGI